MQFNISTDYAVRIVLCLADNDRKMSLQEIAEPMHIPELNCRNILSRLKTAGIVSTILGVHGGYILQKTPEEITLQSIYDAVLESTRINRCLEEDCYCSRGAVETCPVRRYYTRIQVVLDEAFSITIAELMKNEDETGDGSGA